MRRWITWIIGVGTVGFVTACTPEGAAIRCGAGTYLEGDECLPEEDDTDDTDITEDTDTDESEDTEPDDTDIVEPDKSPKRGIAYDLRASEDFSAISPGVSWWYNWYFHSVTPAAYSVTYEMDFVPMLWGHNAESDYLNLEIWFLDHPDVDDLLVMNEPNLVDQANLRPEAAVAHWLRYEQFQADMLADHGRSIRLIGPALTWGTMPGYYDPIVWLDDFYAAFEASEGREPHIDALAFHWYDYGLDGQLDRLEGYGKPFWVTEMANWHTAADWTIDTPEKQLQTMIEMVEICESRDDVERYAWFIGRWDPDPHYTSLFASDPGVLSDLGEAYIAQPW